MKSGKKDVMIPFRSALSICAKKAKAEIRTNSKSNIRHISTAFTSFVYPHDGSRITDSCHLTVTNAGLDQDDATAKSANQTPPHTLL